MGTERAVPPGRLRRLAEELEEVGFDFGDDPTRRAILLDEIDYAVRPPVHERRVSSYGAAIAPTVKETKWSKPTQLVITRHSIDHLPIDDARRFADGMSSWLVRDRDDSVHLVAFDRPAGSERDLVVVADATGSTLIQRHPSGMVRIVGPFGVYRWEGVEWHHEPPVGSLIDVVSACSAYGDREVLAKLLSFAVHDLGARGIGASLVYRPYDTPIPPYELRLPEPPPLHITKPTDLALLRHALAQVDGAAVIDGSGLLRQIGVRLVPSPEAESDVDGLRGMRHTSARRYSFDDSKATVIVVSEDGPVTVLRNGEMLGRSDPT